MLNENNFKTLQSLLTCKNKLNAAITRRSEFKTFKIYQYVLDNTKELDIFENITWTNRFYYLINHNELQYCPICNKPYIYFSNSEKSYKSCRHHSNLDRKQQSADAKSRRLKNKQKFIDSIIDKKLMLDDNIFFNQFNFFLNKKENYAFLLTEKTFDFYHDLVVRTENVLDFDIDDFKFSERLYILKNNILQYPTCKYCSKKVAFINRIKGYQCTCGNAKCRQKQLHEFHDHRTDELISSCINTDRYEIVNLPAFLNIEPLTIKCKKCGEKTDVWLINGKVKKAKDYIRCSKCDCASKPEFEIYEYLKTIYKNDILKNNKSVINPKEIDIYISAKKIAFEFDGLFWHSENQHTDKNYHLEKTIECEKQGIHLVHIFENEWKYRQDIVKSRIKNLLGIYDEIVFARKCEIREIDSKISKEFQDDNHIQGSINAKINLGLFYKNNLISIMTFSKPRFNKKYEWELLRFCNKLGYHIPGAASKLLTYFEKNYKPKSLISYADRRWSMNSEQTVYHKLKFKLDHISKPDYWYFKNHILRHRSYFQKHKLKNLLKNFDPDKSEIENMTANGYQRIFDCGNLVFIKEYN